VPAVVLVSVFVGVALIGIERKHSTPDGFAVASAMKNGKTMRLLLPPTDFLPRLSSFSLRRA
jgi:hypothetical protein